MNIDLWVESSLIRKPVTLSGGEQSDYYYDVKKLLLEPDSLKEITRIIDCILEYNKIRIKSVGGMETGSIPLVTSLSLDYDVPGFYVRKQAKGYGLNKQVEGILISPCILVEDVVTTGDNILKAVEAVQDKAKVLAVFSVVDRSDGSPQRTLESVGIRYFTLYKHKEEEA
jgi:orotate phosphoribosyltransferase